MTKTKPDDDLFFLFSKHGDTGLLIRYFAVKVPTLGTYSYTV
jgi:hypothetical protein